MLHGGGGGSKNQSSERHDVVSVISKHITQSNVLERRGRVRFPTRKAEAREKGRRSQERGGRPIGERRGFARTPRRCREPRSMSLGPRCRVSRRQAPSHGDVLSAGLAFRTRCGQTVARETNPAQQPLFVNEVYLAHDHTQSLTEWRRRWTSRRFCARCSPLSGSSFLRAGTVSSLLLVLTRHSPMHRVISPHLLGACLCPGPAVSLRDAKINDATAVLGGPQSSDR